ncbi:MAG: protein GlmU [Desulfobacterales bacterium]|jgi:UDP-N-acetylglucosamine/UDP-N-acetylgalactosamine diphosphorylase
MTPSKNPKVRQLIEKGVRIDCPDSIQIGDEVDIERVSADGVEVYAGSKIFGKSTVISRGVKIGLEGPATVIDCQMGAGVELKGGFFEKAVFLEKARAGLGAHVREASIFEEQASIAHTVGTKHTILFPFVTLGSLINFCDCLMAGGTSRKNHSEVGSSYIHFNFTPNQDKATASLIGDVPQGVLINQAPIFLGGQGGLVGPCRLSYGTTVAAGTIVRKDELRPGRLIYGGFAKEGNMRYRPGKHGNDRRTVVNNLVYIANLIALYQWYRHVRRLFVSTDFSELLLAGLKEKLNWAISERVDRLDALGHNKNEGPTGPESGPPGATSAAVKQRREFIANRSQLKDLLEPYRNVTGDERSRDAFLETVHRGIQKMGPNYIAVIQQLSPSEGERATAWLQEIVDQIVKRALTIIPPFK